MTQKQISKTLGDYRESLENLLPSNKKSIGILWLCLKEILDELILLDNTKLSKKALSRRNKNQLDFDNILKICSTSIILSNKQNLDSLLSAFGHMDAKLFQIHSDVQNARKQVNIIMNKISKRLPNE